MNDSDYWRWKIQIIKDAWLRLLKMNDQDYS
jgi:hypothetical protein